MRVGGCSLSRPCEYIVTYVGIDVYNQFIFILYDQMFTECRHRPNWERVFTVCRHRPILERVRGKEKEGCGIPSVPVSAVDRLFVLLVPVRIACDIGFRDSICSHMQALGRFSLTM